MSVFLACPLTMAIETGYFYLAGYRDGLFPALCLAANAATNLCLHLLCYLFGYSRWLIALLEVCVVLAEYAVFRLALGPSKRLLFHTLAANLLSMTVGSLLLRGLLRLCSSLFLGLS